MTYASKSTGEIQPQVRTKFNYDRNAASNDSAPEQAEDGKTQQNFLEETDINTIVNSFLKTGQMPENLKLPQYIDYEGVFDFQSAMNTMMEAEESFMSMPAQVRAQFDNDPQRFLEFCSNESNRPELEKLGLLRPKPVVESPPASPPPAKPAETSSPT